MVAISAFIRRGLYGAAGKGSYAIAVEAFMLLRRECFEWLATSEVVHRTPFASLTTGELITEDRRLLCTTCAAQPLVITYLLFRSTLSNGCAIYKHVRALSVCAEKSGQRCSEVFREPQKYLQFETFPSRSADCRYQTVQITFSFSPSDFPSTL